MANFLQQLRLGGTTYDFYDSEFIIDNRSAAGAALTGVSKASTLFDGMQITYWLNKAAGANATLNLTFPDTTTTGAIPCYYNGTTRLSTHYPAGSIIHFTYRTNVKIGNTTISAGWWSDAVGSVTYASSAGGLSAEIANARLPLRLQASSMTGQTTVANVLQQGWHYINPSSGTDSSAPPFKQVDGQTGKDYRVMVTAYNDSWLQQIATDYRSNDVFIRRRQSGTWQPWTALVKMPQGATAAQLTPTTGTLAIFDSGRNATIKGATGASVDTSGNLTANNFIGSSLTASQAVSTDANKRLVSNNLAVTTATDETTEATRFVHSVTEDAVGKITVKTRPMPSIPNIPSAPTVNGNYIINQNDGTISWTPESTEVLTIVATPESGAIFSTTILYTDFLAALSAGKIIQISIPTYSMSGILNSKTGGYYTFNVYNADDNTVYNYVFSDDEDNNNLLQLVLEDSQKSMPSGFQVAIPDAGHYVLSSTGSETAWVKSTLEMTGTPLGNLTQDYITTTTSWSDYQVAISSRSRLILSIPTINAIFELTPQETDGSLVNALAHIALGNDIYVSVFTFSALNNSGTVQFRYNNQIISYTEKAYNATNARYTEYFANSEGLSDGNYILNQSSGTSTWSALPTIPNTPIAPTVDGDYILNVNSNTPTWTTASYIPTSVKGAANGVAELDSNNKIPVVQNNYLYGKCSTSGSTAAKTVTIAGYNETTIANMEGVTVFVAFNNPNTASSPTLNVSNTSAHPIAYGTYQDPVAVGNFSSGLHAFTLVKGGDNVYYWWVNEGRNTIPEAPSSTGDYQLNINSNGIASWTTASGGSSVVVGTLTLTTTWQGSGPYTQTVSITGGTANSKIDLQPNSTVLTQMTTDGVTAMYIENNNGTFTVYTLGAAPSAALSIQYTRMEVS